MGAGKVCTIGHSNRPLDELLAMLAEAGVRRLVDVRRYPRSRYNPQFNDRALAAALREIRVGYRHAPELGGRREAPAAGSPNQGWRPGPFRNYADHALTAGFRQALAALEAEAGEEPVAIMCAEKDWRQCHRRIITDYLLIGGWAVDHLTSPGMSEAAALDDRAVKVDDGLHYRPSPPAQRELF